MTAEKQQLQTELDPLPALTKNEALDKIIDDVAHIQSTLDCMHGMLEALLAANGIEVVEEEDGLNSAITIINDRASIN